MERYFKFDTRQFLKDSKTWYKKLYELELKLKSITELSVPSGNGLPSGGDISQPTERIALQRDDVMKEIRKIENYIQYLHFAMDQLDDEEKEILTISYFCDNWDKKELIGKWCETNAASKQTFYNKKNDAEKHFSRIIEALM